MCAHLRSGSLCVGVFGTGHLPTFCHRGGFTRKTLQLGVSIALLFPTADDLISNYVLLLPCNSKGLFMSTDSSW